MIKSLWGYAKIVYWLNMAFWLLIGLPIIIIGAGFAGDTDVADIIDTAIDEALRGNVIAVWLVSPLWLLVPYLLLWFAKRRARALRDE